MLSRIRKKDNVFVTAGKDKGKEGTVIEINKKKDQVLVKDVGLVSRHVKAKKHGEKSGIIKSESYIPLCKVMPVCLSCKKPCRMQVKFLEDGKKVRICHHCKEQF